MAEATPDLRHVPKREAYARLRRDVASVLAGVTDEVAAMATISCLLHQGFGHLWAGFYRVVAPDLLRVGPYQGTLGCLEIAFGRGVCGTAAARRESVVVPDVHAFPGHIACDSASASEIVVPVFDASDRLIAVLDIDSTERARFDEIDRVELEALVRWFRAPGTAQSWA
jgi:GAF domain-containing protein